MADINSDALNGLITPAEPRESKAPATDARLITVIELLFFAYRDFTRDADAILAKFGLGRAHHRVLHFVDRHPGLRVADLLEILKITKQSLAPVLKQLIDAGWIVQQGRRPAERLRALYAVPPVVSPCRRARGAAACGRGNAACGASVRMISRRSARGGRPAAGAGGNRR
jgi:hypothetical protein